LRRNDIGYCTFGYLGRNVCEEFDKVVRFPKPALTLPDGVPVVFAVTLSLWPPAVVVFAEIVVGVQGVFYLTCSVLLSIPLVIPAMVRLRRSHPALFAVIVLALGGLTFVAFVEIYVARPLLLTIYVIFAAILSMPVGILVVQRFVKTGVMLYLLFLCAFAVLHTAPWSSRHVFLRDLQRIKPGRYLDRADPGMIVMARRHGPGMTFAEVEQIMQRYPVLIGGKWYRPLKELSEAGAPFAADYEPDASARRRVEIGDGRASYRHGGGPRFNADFGWVDFRNGRVVSVGFLPD